MRRAASQPLLRRHFQETEDVQIDDDDEEEEVQIVIKGRSIGDVDSISKQVTCMKLNKRESKNPCKIKSDEFLSGEKYGSWRQEQKTGAAKLKKQLKVRWAIQKLIDAQMGQFRAHYNRARAPIKMTDVAQILMPKWIPAQELAALYWLGDWRPSTILELLRSSARSVWDPSGVERALTQLINDVRIEEAVIDEEMTEIQSNCVLHLPFGPAKNDGSGPPVARIRSEFKKIHRVIVKAENLRMKALDLAVKKVLSQTDAAEFLVAFVEIQDAIHDFAMKSKSRKAPVCVEEIGVHSPSYSG